MDRILHYLNHSGFFFFLIISLAKQNITTYKQEIEPDFTHNPPRDKNKASKYIEFSVNTHCCIYFKSSMTSFKLFNKVDNNTIKFSSVSWYMKCKEKLNILK